MLFQIIIIVNILFASSFYTTKYIKFPKLYSKKMENHIKIENFDLIKINSREFILEKYYKDIQKIREIDDDKIVIRKVIEILKRNKIQTPDIILFDLEKKQ